MKSPFLIILISSIASLSLSQTCTPPYWEIQKDVLVINEPDKFAAQEFSLASVDKVQSGALHKTFWNLTNIHAKSSGSNSGVAVAINNNTITVSNYSITLNLTFSASRKTGNNESYNGNGSARINVWVSYVKQYVVGDGQITFKYVSLSLNYTNITTFYSPTPIDENKNVFNSLVENDIVAQLKTYYNTNLVPAIKTQIESQKTTFTFNGSYTYKFNNYSASYLMSVSSLNIVNKSSIIINSANLAIGYNASINGSQTCASNPKPYDETSSAASFFSNEFCKDLFTDSLDNNPDWAQIDVNFSYSSDIFSFEMKDLTQVIPEAIKTYPGLFVKVYVRCNSTDTDNTFVIDPLHKKMQANALWNCTLFRTGGYGLSGFVANISYTSNLGQDGQRLVNNISSMSVDSIQYYPLLFKVEDQTTATMYIKSVIANFVMTETLGTNFVQPSRISPIVSYADSYIKINNAVGLDLIKQSLMKKMDLKLE